MKREEKNRQTRRRILDGALEEFSCHGYAAGSINAICARQGVSKGIVYHYFATKDALFLACVGECFDRLTACIQQSLQDRDGAAYTLEDYFAARSRFFQENPVYQHIFSQAVISPPAHLRASIQTCRQDFDACSVRTLERLLAPVALRPGIRRDEVVETFRQFQDFINIRYQMTGTDGQAFAVHEENCRKALDILLYGVIERENNHV